MALFGILGVKTPENRNSLKRSEKSIKIH